MGYVSHCTSIIIFPLSKRMRVNFHSNKMHFLNKQRENYWYSSVVFKEIIPKKLYIRTKIVVIRCSAILTNIIRHRNSNVIRCLAVFNKACSLDINVRLRDSYKYAQKKISSLRMGNNTNDNNNNKRIQCRKQFLRSNVWYIVRYMHIGTNNNSILSLYKYIHICRCILVSAYTFTQYRTYNILYIPTICFAVCVLCD